MMKINIIITCFLCPVNQDSYIKEKHYRNSKPGNKHYIIIPKTYLTKANLLKFTHKLSNSAALSAHESIHSCLHTHTHMHTHTLMCGSHTPKTLNKNIKKAYISKYRVLHQHGWHIQKA